MSDLINRQDAIDVLMTMLDSDYLDGYKYLEKLKQLPSVEGNLVERLQRAEMFNNINIPLIKDYLNFEKRVDNSSC